MGFGLLDSCDQVGDAKFVQGRQVLQINGMAADRRKIHGFNHVVDDALKSHACAVFRRIYLGDAISLQLPNFVRNDHAAAAPENLDMGSSVFF